jgi:hypothetical protein
MQLFRCARHALHQGLPFPPSDLTDYFCSCVEFVARPPSLVSKFGSKYPCCHSRFRFFFHPSPFSSPRSPIRNTIPFNFSFPSRPTLISFPSKSRSKYHAAQCFFRSSMSPFPSPRSPVRSPVRSTMLFNFSFASSISRSKDPFPQTLCSLQGPVRRTRFLKSLVSPRSRSEYPFSFTFLFPLQGLVRNSICYILSVPR